MASCAGIPIFADPSTLGVPPADVVTLSRVIGATRRFAAPILVIGNAPTALFHLIEMLEAGADSPALILGFPVGFVGAAEAKEALAGFGRGVPYVTLKGRRGGSALAAAAVNALCGKQPA